MIKYYCNHCGTETDNSRQRLMKFDDKDVHLCGECFTVYNKLQIEHDTNIAEYTKQRDKIIKEFLNIV
jgi:uncharacterized Zn finger protein